MKIDFLEFQNLERGLIFLSAPGPTNKILIWHCLNSMSACRSYMLVCNNRSSWVAKAQRQGDVERPDGPSFPSAWIGIKCQRWCCSKDEWSHRHVRSSTWTVCPVHLQSGICVSSVVQLLKCVQCAAIKKPLYKNFSIFKMAYYFCTKFSAIITERICHRWYTFCAILCKFAEMMRLLIFNALFSSERALFSV